MTITLFNCGAAITCGPCPTCEQLFDVMHPAPSRTVVHRLPTGASAQTGTLTWDTGSGAMTAVAAGSTLCVGGHSYDGPLLYRTGVPYTATLVTLSASFTPAGGPPPISYTLGVVPSCSNPLTEISRNIVAATCDIAPSVITTGGSCPPCCAEAQAWNNASNAWVGGAPVWRGSVAAFSGNANQSNCNVTVPCDGKCCTPGWGVANNGTTASVNIDFSAGLDALGYSASQKLAFRDATWAAEAISITIAHALANGATWTISLGGSIGKPAAGSYVVNWANRQLLTVAGSGPLCGIESSRVSTAFWSPSFRMPDGCGKVMLGLTVTSQVTQTNPSGTQCSWNAASTKAWAIGVQK